MGARSLRAGGAGGPPRSLREQNKIDKQAAIYDAAMALFAQRSFNDVTVEEICDRAGVARATFFRLFQNKAGLIEEFYRRVAVVLDDEVRSKRAAGMVALRIMARVIESEWLTNQPHMHDLIAEYIRNLDQLYDLAQPKIEATTHGGRALVSMARRYIVEGQEGGAIRDDIDPTFMAVIFMSQVGTALTIWAAQPEPTPRSFKRKIRQITTVLLDGIST